MSITDNNSEEHRKETQSIRTSGRGTDKEGLAVTEELENQPIPRGEGVSVALEVIYFIYA